jgi:hypothetical protein
MSRNLLDKFCLEVIPPRPPGTPPGRGRKFCNELKFYKRNEHIFLSESMESGYKKKYSLFKSCTFKISFRFCYFFREV